MVPPLHEQPEGNVEQVYTDSHEHERQTQAGILVDAVQDAWHHEQEFEEDHEPSAPVQELAHFECLGCSDRAKAYYWEGGT